MFDLAGRVAVITGGAGLLGRKHAEAILEMGGRPVLWDLRQAALDAARAEFSERFQYELPAFAVDITNPARIREVTAATLEELGHIDILINNAAMTVEADPKNTIYFKPFEDYDVELWRRALDVSLTGTFLCTQAIGRHMVARKQGVVLNIASDVGVISPDHRIYQAEGEYPGTTFNTPASYATCKAGLIHFTKYLATYWAKDNIRVNALSPAGVFNNQDPEFVKRLTRLIPMGRMATRDEYKGAVIFLVSDASAFLTGFNLVMDGGRTAW